MTSPSIALLLCLPALQAQGSASTSLVVIPHEHEDLCGSEACVVGDVDADGVSDVLVGAPLTYHDSGPWTGAAFLLSGRLSTSLRVFRGHCEYDWFGEALAAGGEIDGDGVPDAGAPFQDGTLCVAPPIKRTAVQTATASGAQPCTGVYAFDFNVRIASGVDPTLITGQQVWSQYWSRDTGVPSGTGLTNGLTFTIAP